ncbi:MAG: hypothetical protein ACOYI4_01805 [Christensenellales bacterium]|jgi:hypothetical protein
MIKLGSSVKDTLTGFAGMATGRTDWLYGCSRICIEPAELKDGKPIDAQWFDEQRIEVIEVKAPVVSKDSSATSGGPYDAPTRSSDPTR